MTEITRYRLIGSIFLLAVAAIFLPMIFDAPPPSVQDISTSAELPRGTLPLKAVNPETTEDTIEKMKVSQAEMSQSFARSDMLERVDKLRNQVDDDGYWIDNGTRFGEPILQPLRSDTKAFAVQLATFDEAANAENLRELLRQDSQEAFISQYKQRGLIGEKIRYRVAVGPMLSHTLAKEKRTSYTQKYGVQAIVVAMTQ
jgi:cell division septation protein DedD